MNRKKWFCLFSALLTAMLLPVSGLTEDFIGVYYLEGYVTGLIDGGFVINDKELGEIICNQDDTTVLEGDFTEEGIQQDDYVIVQYNGRMTRSIPPQVHADRVTSYRLEGTVLEVMTDNVIALDVPEQGEIWVYAEEFFSDIFPGMQITVYYDGIMAMSYPARISAREVIVPVMTGMVGEITEQGFLLTIDDETSMEIAVDDQTVISMLNVIEATEETEARTEEELLYAPETAEEIVEEVTDEMLNQPAADPSQEDATENEPETVEAEADEADADPEDATIDAEALPTENIAISYLQEGSEVAVYFTGILEEGVAVTALKIKILP